MLAGRVRRLRSAFAQCLIVALAACGGGGGGAPAPAATPPAPKAVQVSIFGDSTMAGTQYINGQYVVTKVLRADLEADLQAQLGTSVTVVEDDQLGTTMADLLNGAQGFQPFATYLQTDKSPIVVENFGINDRLQGFTAAQFQQNLNRFIALAQAAGKTVVLEEPNPICVQGTADQEQVFSDGQTIQEFVSIVDNTAQAYGLALIKQYDQIKAMPGFCKLMSDGWVHPTAALYQVKAQNQANVLIPLIRKLQ
jgi:lysophospholipase L1-like esterase